MELLDRYLQAVRRHLPWQRQEDIIAELRANLESQLEDKQEELGRPLRPAEAEEWVKGLGSPFQMAGPYLPQQYLIGPSIYPLYLYVLRLVSMWTIVVYVLVSTVVLVLSSTATSDTVAQAAGRLPFILIQTAAWVTAIFAALEFFAVRYPEKCPPIAAYYAKWSPRDLPPLETKTSPGKKPRSYAQAVAGVIFGFLFLGWLLVVPKHPFLMFGPGAGILHASPLRLAHVWWTFYWLVIGLNAVELAWKCTDLVRETWGQTDRYRHLVVKFLGLIPMFFIVSVPGQQYVLLRHPDVDMARYGQTLDSINRGVHSVSLLILTIASLQLLWDLGKLVYEGYRDRAVTR